MTDLRRIERHEGIFPVAELDWVNTYYEGRLDGKPYAFLHTQKTTGGDFVMLHITLMSFGRRVLRECLADYVVLNKMLKKEGIIKMIHLKDYPFTKWEKLMRVLGFAEPRDIEIKGKLYKTVCMGVI